MSEITPEKVAHLQHLLASVGDLPWFLSDCEGDMAIWRESALTHVSRECTGEIVGYSTPSSYKRNDLIASWDLDTWDEGEDEDDDERRRMAELIVEAVNALPLLIAAAEAVVVEGQTAPIVMDRATFEQRVNERFDNAIRKLGYESLTFMPATIAALREQILNVDVDLAEAAQADQERAQ